MKFSDLIHKIHKAGSGSQTTTQTTGVGTYVTAAPPQANSSDTTKLSEEEALARLNAFEQKVSAAAASVSGKTDHPRKTNVVKSGTSPFAIRNPFKGV